MNQTEKDRNDLPVIVVIGAGFGGLNAVRQLKRTNARVILIDRKNYHLFQPLLYQVATAGLTPAQIAQPIRSIVRDVSNCEVYLDEVTDIETNARVVKCGQRSFRYDYLIIASGAMTNYFGNDGWQTHAPSLKSLYDATEIRKKILRAFELAESEEDKEKRRRLLNFVVIGGGPTGVEIAGAINELAKVTLRKDFRNIDPKSANVYLIEAGATVLSSFDEKLSLYATKKLNAIGVDVITKQSVEQIDANKVVLSSGGTIACNAVIWAAGVKCSGPSRWLGVSNSSDGRIEVDSKLRSLQHSNIFVVGDAAKAKDQSTGMPYPGIAPVAIQQGQFVGRYLRSMLSGKNSDQKEFRYRDKGMLATIGRSFAVGNVGSFKFTGLLAWIVWSVVHILYLVDFRNRILVLIDWLWSYLTYQRGSRLIVDNDNDDEG